MVTHGTYKQLLYGPILGDILGSIYEGSYRNCKTDKPKEIDLLNPQCRFTDDTVLTIAIADALIAGESLGWLRWTFSGRTYNYTSSMYKWAHSHPHAGYGMRFLGWFYSRKQEPYYSWGNGAAMRVSPIGWAFHTLEKTLTEAKRSAEITHNHPDGTKAAQAVAAAVYLARNGSTKAEIREYIENTFAYDLRRSLNEIRPDYVFSESARNTVPEAIIAFLESENFPHAIQLAISIGGDTDTIACIAGGIAEAFYKKIPKEFVEFANERLSERMKLVLKLFRKKYA